MLYPTNILRENQQQKETEPRRAEFNIKKPISCSMFSLCMYTI